MAERKAGQAFGTPEVLTGTTLNTDLLDLEVDRNGNALALVTRKESPSRSSVLVYSRPAGSIWSGAVTVWTGGVNPDDGGVHRVVYGSGEIAFDAAGNAVIAWSDNPNAFNQDSFIAEIHAAQRNANGTYVAEQTIDTRGTNQALDWSRNRT